jgi:hypothetical protein
MPSPPRHTPSKSTLVRTRAAREAGQRAAAAAMARVDRARAAHARAAAAAHSRFVCPGCGLAFPVRRAARPAGPPPLRCLCCEFLLTIPDARTREAARWVMERVALHRRFGGRDAPLPAQRPSDGGDPAVEGAGLAAPGRLVEPPSGRPPLAS